MKIALFVKVCGQFWHLWQLKSYPSNSFWFYVFPVAKKLIEAYEALRPNTHIHTYGPYVESGKSTKRRCAVARPKLCGLTHFIGYHAQSILFIYLHKQYVSTYMPTYMERGRQSL